MNAEHSPSCNVNVSNLGGEICNCLGPTRKPRKDPGMAQVLANADPQRGDGRVEISPALYKALVAAVDDLDVAFVCTNISDGLTPQARAAVGRAWAKVQAAILLLRPDSAEAEAIKSPHTAYGLRGLLEEYLQRRNDSKFDLLWDEFDQKVREVLG